MDGKFLITGLSRLNSVQQAESDERRKKAGFPHRWSDELQPSSRVKVARALLVIRRYKQQLRREAREGGEADKKGGEQ